MSAGLVDVSVVVCTWNRARLLRDALASLGVLETGGAFHYEIVVVDNASTDETPQVIEEAARESPVPLRGVREPRPGVANARNRGILETQAPWIAFFDDDQVADPAWLRELLALAREKQVRCVGGANRLLLPEGEERSLAPVCRWLLGESMGGDQPYRYSGRVVPGTGNLLIHRNVFEQVGAFDGARRNAGEDGDLFRRICAADIAVWHNPRAVMYHVVPAYRLGADYLRWKSLGYGRGLAEGMARDWGRAWLLAMTVARLGHAALVAGPALFGARLRGEQDRALGARCMIWRAEGYARAALHYLSPRLFPQRRFLAQLEFRAERDLFPAAVPPPEERADVRVVQGVAP